VLTHLVSANACNGELAELIAGVRGQ